MSGDLGNSYNIDIWGLLIALGMVAVAAIISELMHMGIGKTLMWSSCRALVQLCAMGFIIGYVIRSNSVWMVFALMAVMLVAAVQIVMSRARGIPKGLAGPIFLSLVITMLLMLALVTELIVRPHPWYAPQLVVPLTGMLLGNTVTALAVGLSRFYESMEERRDEVDMMLALGATPWESARPSIVSSIRLGLLPTTASLASSGIVTIPGMMAEFGTLLRQIVAEGLAGRHRVEQVRTVELHPIVGAHAFFGIVEVFAACIDGVRAVRGGVVDAGTGDHRINGLATGLDVHPLFGETDLHAQVGVLG